MIMVQYTAASTSSMQKTYEKTTKTT